MNDLLQIDRDLFLALNGLRAPALDGLMWQASQTLPWLPLFLLLAWAMWRNCGRSLWLPVLVAALVITLSDQGASGLLKPLVKRPRPCNEPALAEMVHILRGYCSSSYSFASSHASNSVGLAAFCTGVFRHWRPVWLLAAVWAWAFLHSYSRIYLGVHYPLDLLGGAAVGLLAASFGLWLLARIRRLPALRGLLIAPLLVAPLGLSAQSADRPIFSSQWEDAVAKLFNGVFWVEISLAAAATAALVFFIWLSRKARVRLERWSETSLIQRLPEIKIQSLTLVDKSVWLRVVGLTLRGARLALVLLAFYVYLPVVFSLFPPTRGIAVQLVQYVLEPLEYVGAALLAYLPKLFFVVVIAVFTRLLLRLIGTLFRAIGEGKIVLQGFYADWAKPTYNLIRFLVIAFALVVVFPYLPGSDSPAFQGVSIFLGVLLSLGSSSAISNVIAGLVLTYMRPFQLGDYVKVDQLEGLVVEKTLFVTRIRTPKNVEISITNAQIISQPIVNYSTQARETGVLLHTSVTIGYDAPWKTVEALLVEAARRTPGLLQEPAPFVLQTGLQDFYVSYEINVRTNEPQNMVDIYSNLHRNIQDCFNEGGVEIMSPHYFSHRDGNETTIPTAYRDASYRTPPFRVQNLPADES